MYAADYSFAVNLNFDQFGLQFGRIVLWKDFSRNCRRSFFFL